MDADDAFVSNISRKTDVDTNGYLDVIAHGTPNGIQITHNGQHMTVDHRTASRLIQNSDGYNGQTFSLFAKFCANPLSKAPVLQDHNLIVCPL